MQFSPVLPTPPVQPRSQPYDRWTDTAIYDTATVYLTLTVTGSDIYDPGCLIIGEGEAQLRWVGGDQQLRWLGYDANPRWEADLRLGTGQC